MGEQCPTLRNQDFTDNSGRLAESVDFYHPSKRALLNGQASHFRMGDGLHYGGGDTALLTIGRTTGEL